MEFTVRQKINCGILIPDKKSITIEDFIFLPTSENENLARYIQAKVQAVTIDEAKKTAQRHFREFLPRLTLLDNSKYHLLDDLS